MRARDFITELFRPGQDINFKWSRPYKDEVNVLGKTPQGHELSINFWEITDDIVAIDFTIDADVEQDPDPDSSPKSGHELTRHGEEFAVFTQVVNAITQYLNKLPKNNVFFQVKRTEAQREPLYLKIANRVAKQLGFRHGTAQELEVTNPGLYNKFDNRYSKLLWYTKEQQGVAENFADGRKFVEPNFDFEWEEAERYPEFVKLGKDAWIELARKGKAVTINSAQGINNTDAADPDSFKLLAPEKQKRALAQLEKGTVEMPIVAVYSDGHKELIGGNTRLTAMMARDGRATIWAFRVPGKQGVAEAGSFSYGKPPRKGSVADLAAKKRKEHERGQQPIEPKDQQVGNSKVTKGMAEGSLNEFAPDGFNGGDDDEGFSPEIAKMAQEDGFTKGAGLADGATLERAITINHWHSQHGGMYKQYFTKGFKAGRMNKINHDNKQYNLNLQLNKDGSVSHGEQGVAEGERNTTPTVGINVRSDGDIDYAGLIVDGRKKYESRKTDSLGPYVGKTVGIVRTGAGPAVAIGQVTVGEPIVVDAEKFNSLRKQHLVPQGSKFDIDVDGIKYLYPMINPVRWDNERPVKQRGIVARKIQEQGMAEAFNQPYSADLSDETEHGDYDSLTQLPDGSHLSVMFNNQGDGEYQVEFWRGPSQEVTGEGDAQRIFATVLSTIQRFIREHNPWRLTFSATKDVEPGQNSESRAKLYNRLVDRYAAAWGYDALINDLGDQVEYELTRLKPNVAENFKDGKNPGRKGLSKRMGVNTKASVSALRKVAKNSSGEKQRMAHWLANMKSGRKKS